MTQTQETTDANVHPLPRGKRSDKTDQEKKSVKGRKDNKGQEMVIQVSELADAIDELEQLKLKHAAAAEAFNDAVKAVAERSGLMASVVRKVVDARTKDKVEDRRREAAQLNLAFEEIPE